MDDKRLAASIYNKIKPLHDQVSTILLPPLQALAKCFIDHDMHEDWGVGLQHRHRMLSDQHIMLHELQSNGTDLCRPRGLFELDPETIHPSAFLFNAEQTLQAYEYDQQDGRAEFSEIFMHCLREVVLRHGLEEIVAIIAKPHFPPVEERLLANDSGELTGMITTPASNLMGTVTVWAFEDRGDGRVVVAVKACVESETKLHIVVKDEY